MVKQPYCCQINCPNAAAWRIVDNTPGVPYDVAETHACDDHLRALGGDIPGATVESLGYPRTRPVRETFVTLTIDTTRAEQELERIGEDLHAAADLVAEACPGAQVVVDSERLTDHLAAYVDSTIGGRQC